MSDYPALLKVATEAVALACDLIRKHEPGVLTAKGERDFASSLDYLIESEVREYLARQTPEIGFLGEEGGVVNDRGELLWSLDPIDGTVNFVHGLPLCAVSLGLIHDRRPVLGVIEAPFLLRQFHAIEGAGAYADGWPLRVGQATRLADAVVSVGDYAVGEDSDRINRLRVAVTAALARRVLRVRMFGTAAIDLAWVAEGRTDACVVLSNHPWDTAAGVVLAREAGAAVVDRDGTPHTFDSGATIAANPALAKQLVRLIADAGPS